VAIKHKMKAETFCD